MKQKKMSKNRSKYIKRVVYKEGGIPDSWRKHVIVKEKSKCPPGALHAWLGEGAGAPKVLEQGSHFSPDSRPFLSRLPSETGRRSGQP